MAVTSFQLLNNITKLPADIVDDHIYISPDQENGTGQDLSTGIRAIIDYHDLQSTDGTTQLQAIIEGKNANNQYYPIAYQFDVFNTVGFNQQRILAMQPDMFWFDAGIDNGIFVGGSTIAQISNQTGLLPAVWRICIRIRDNNSTFTSVRFSVYGERFNNL